MSANYSRPYIPVSHLQNDEGRGIDLILFACVLILCAVGSLMVFSTTAVSSNDSGTIMGFFNRHNLSIALGIFLAFIAFNISPTTDKKCTIPLLIISVFSLALVLVLGRSAGGATRWIQLGGLRVQPGEFVKLVTVIAMATYIDKFREKLGSFVYGVMIPMGGFSSGSRTVLSKAVK